jgi:LytS/YehU family sensor histidine kinase
MPLDSRRGRLLVLHAAVGVVLLLLREGAVHLVSPWISVLSEMPFRTRLLTTTPVGALEYSLMMGFVYAIVYQRRLYLQDLDALRLQAERDRAELQVFKMQLQPHFLGNALNSITALIYRDPAAAEDALDRLQALLRQVLRNTAVQEVPLREELGFLRPYVELEQIRFGDRIQVEWRMDEEVLDAMVPHLILQPVVENAVKHALALRNAPGCLSIAAHAAGTVLRLEVCDSGSGSRSKRAGARGTGLGLSTSRLRLKRLYGDAYRLDVAVDPVAGSRVTIELPLRFAARDGTGAVDAPGGSRTPGPRPRL